MIKSTRTMPRIRHDDGDITDQADPVVKRTVAWLATQSAPLYYIQMKTLNVNERL